MLRERIQKVILDTMEEGHTVELRGEKGLHHLAVSLYKSPRLPPRQPHTQVTAQQECTVRTYVHIHVCWGIACSLTAMSM